MLRISYIQGDVSLYCLTRTFAEPGLNEPNQKHVTSPTIAYVMQSMI